jgi:outer membrane protein assembly factor BamB/tRNA A-37 threonylcarbamoyl transferase component Bud32
MSEQSTRHISQPNQNSLSVPDSSLQPGQVLQSRYRILGIIGMGGMGAVYQARDLHFPNVPRLCAVKEMINIAQDQQLREQTIRNFEREAEILATLNHPSIPQIYDYFSFGDRAYLVQEYIQGRDLEALLNSIEGFLSVDHIRQWAIEICDVLSYLHNHSPEPIVFRDMKPSNVMIDQHQRVRLIDFGIAKQFQVGQQGTMIGTEGYSPPEQYKGIASPAGDIYALGATLHHLLTKRDPRLEPPFSFDQKPIASFNPSVTEALASVVMRALSYDSEQRYASAEAMKQSLIAAGENGGIAPAAAPQVPAIQAPVQSQPAVQQPTYAAPAIPRPDSVQVVSGPADLIKPIWQFQVEDAVRSTPMVYNGVVFVGSYDNNLWALDAKDGSLRWKFATEGGIGASPSYGSGAVYIGSADNRMYAVDVRNGKRLWTFKTEGKIFTRAATSAGLIIFGSDDGKLYAVKSGPTAAKEVWRYDLMTPIRSSPVVDNDKVFFGTDGGEFACLDISGEVQWRFQSRRRLMSTALIKDNVAYVGSDDWYFYALDVDQGYPIWRFRTKGAIVSSPAYGDGKVMFGSADGVFYAIEAVGGREVWRFEVGKPITSSPAVFRESVYFGATDGSVYSLHIKSGDLLWRFQAKGPVLSSPAVVDDTVYIGSDDKMIYALQA